MGTAVAAGVSTTDHHGMSPAALGWCRSIAAWALIASLGRSGRPVAIIRLVVAVVFAAIQCQIWRAWPHVGQERLKRLPAFAHHDPTATIIAIVRASWITATRQHVLPAPIFTRTSPVPSSAVGCHSFCRGLQVVTAATLCVIASQVAGNDLALSSAITTTSPGDAPAAWKDATWGARYNHQSAKALARQVKGLHSTNHITRGA